MARGAFEPEESARLLPLAAGYGVPQGHVDELFQDDGTLRRAWRRFADASDLGAGALAHAARTVAHQIHENGVTYNVYHEASGPARPWSVDVLPMLIPAEEWDDLELGLRQRARLLNAVAADLYGEQALLTERVVPARLVLDHPGFLRPCRGVRAPGGVHVHLVAFDLARTSDRRWEVIGTRVQAPSGLGYALENRSVIARLFPHAARELGVRPLAPFFDRLQEALVRHAPCDDDAPSVVLLTPGKFNETYFEHVFLARELGIPLVEGGDLTVRHDRVFLKTVSGLRPVHAIWRRVDDDYCDPLELRADSRLGLAGLVQAWRAGHVLVANAFGLSVLEAPALGAFMAAASRRLLGEDLVTPSVPTWWCGENSSDAAPPHGDLVVQSAWSTSAMTPVALSQLRPDDRRRWEARVEAMPEACAMQSFVPLSHVPVWTGSAIENRPASIRVFLFADGDGDYFLMPGGLCRVAGTDRQMVSGQRGGGSKDTWILSGAPSGSLTRLEASRRPPGAPATNRTTSSRAAEMLFWLGRYAERSENSARLLRAVLGRMAGTIAWPAAYQPLLLRTCLGQSLILTSDLPPDWSQKSMAAVNRALIDGIHNRDTRRSLRFNVRETVRVAESVRDRLSSDNWRVLAHLNEQMSGVGPTSGDLNDAVEIIDDVILSLVAAGGLEMAHMTRDDGWRFLSIGRHLERLTFVAATIHAVETERATGDVAVLEWLLDLSDSLITYRARQMRRPEWSGVSDLLVFDERNPRSAMFQVAKLAKHVRALPDAGLADWLEEIERVQWLAASANAGQGQLFENGPSRPSLAEAAERLARTLSEALTLRYFSHVYERSLPMVTR